MTRLSLACLAAFLFAAGAAEEPRSPQPLKVGIIGLDTSHVTAFTGILNKDNKGPMQNVRVVAAFPGGSPDIDISANRLKGFTDTLRDKHKVEIVDSIADLVKKVDAV